ncbi:YidH family protein [Yoonia sp. 2307UL14-13]|uniref:YidH family protein n=1 Tax=Yoonia sp. 2307UL14-13 TaxID=3126506 RepID=UPI00309EB57A
MNDKNSLAEDRTDWAEDRTDWAEDRTILANERTFAGWMRTGMACLGLALGLKAVFNGFSPTWVPKVVANVFVLLAIFIFWAARNKSCQTQRRMNDHATNAQSSTNMTIIATVLTCGAIATGAILWWF